MLTQYPSPSPLLSLPPLIALQSRYYYPTGQESEAEKWAHLSLAPKGWYPCRGARATTTPGLLPGTRPHKRPHVPPCSCPLSSPGRAHAACS